ncbi:MAG: zinc ribbon domain-containing protein [Thermoplasmata archaeon]|nr:zinc ribbon domain-containing protein [Thermoplasmata archaeon]
MATAAPAPPMICPACHATVTTPSRFCPACGAAMAGSPSSPLPASAGAPPTDIRQRVDQDRGVLKRLQLLIPGYHGYRVNEDLREADSLLRLQIADKVKGVLAQMNDVRANMAQAGQLASLNDLAQVLAELQILEGTIRHAEQGYSGISAPIKVQATSLDRLYEYDYGFAVAADQLAQGVAPVKTAVMGGDPVAVRTAVAQIRDEVHQLQSTFQVRMQAVEGTQVA